ARSGATAVSGVGIRHHGNRAPAERWNHVSGGSKYATGATGPGILRSHIAGPYGEGAGGESTAGKRKAIPGGVRAVPGGDCSGGLAQRAIPASQCEVLRNCRAHGRGTAADGRGEHHPSRRSWANQRTPPATGRGKTGKLRNGKEVFAPGWIGALGQGFGGTDVEQGRKAPMALGTGGGYHRAQAIRGSDHQTGTGGV